MNKIVCLDLDGVSVSEHKKFSTRLVEKQGNDIKNAVDDYFAKYFGSVMIGEATLIDTISPYLSRFNWEGDVTSLLDFWFDEEKEPIQSVLDFARSLRESGTPTFVVTDNPVERTNELWDELLSKYFTSKYVSGETGIKKSHPALWQRIANDSGVALSNIYFSDDDPSNIIVATDAGVHAVLFENPEQLKKSVNKFLQKA